MDTGSSIWSLETLSREDLYALVWQQPLSRIGPRLGISGAALASRCHKLNVPYPPLGYWSKKEAGKPIQQTPLPQQTSGPSGHEASSSKMTIAPVLRRITASPRALHPTEPTAAPPSDPNLDDLDSLHPKVKAWVNEHAQEQRKRLQEHNRRSPDSWSWGQALMPDLTKRDLYRFRATSTLLHAIEEAGGRVEKALLIGTITVKVIGREMEFKLVEKLKKPLLAPQGEAANWTAYPHHHQSGLFSSGMLRASFVTYIPGGRPDWVETSKHRIDALMPEIVEQILAAGPKLKAWDEQRERDRLESQRREQERYERQRQREQEERRWRLVRDAATNWREKQQLDLFLQELERRMAIEGDAVIEGRPLSEWIAWVRMQSDALDPFAEGVAGLFARVAKQW